MRLLRYKIEALQLGQPLNQLANIWSEEFVDLCPRGARVLNGVVQQGDRDRRLVQMHVGEDGRDFEGV